MSAGAKSELLLRDVIRTSHIVPAQHRRFKNLLQLFPHVKHSRRAWTEKPLVCVRGQKINVLDGGGKGADGLNAIDAKPDAAFAQKFSDGGNVDAPAGDKVTRCESDQTCILIHLALHVDGANLPQFANVHQPHFDASFGQRHPWINV